MAMDGIVGLLDATQKGRVRYEVINDAVGLSILECEGYFFLYLKLRLFSLHIFIQEPQERDGTYALTWDGSVLVLKNADRISIGYNLQTTLTVPRDFSNTMNTAKSLVCVTDNSNDNL